MKTSRMLEIIIILLSDGEAKAKDLAERFDCTTKTIYRDVEFIKESGIPIISELGRNGGFKIGQGVARKNKTLSLKEEQSIIKMLEDHNKIPARQLEQIMTTIEGLFRENTVDWIDGEFEDSKMDKLFRQLKEAIINCNVVELEVKRAGEVNIIKVEPYQIFIGYNELSLRLYHLKDECWDEVVLKEVKGIRILEEKFMKRYYLKATIIKEF